VVVGLAARVVQLEALAADLEVEAGAVGLVGVAVARGPVRSGEPELPLVDDAVVSGGLDVALEARRDGFVRDDARRLPAVLLGFGLVQLDAEAVVDVAVGEDRGVEPVGAPGAQRLVHLGAEEGAARVDDDEARGGAECGCVRERGDERGGGEDLGQVPELAERVVVGGIELSGEEAVGGLEHVGHATESSRAPLVDPRMETCSHSPMTDEAAGAAPEDGALARNQAVRRRRVLDATLALADKGGFEAVQMRDVAAEAGVALGTVYRYFSSKERLLLEANVGQVEALGAALLSRPPKGETPADRVVDVLRRACHVLEQRPDATAAMVRALGSAQPSEADAVRRVSEAMTAIITGAMHEGDSSERDRAVARVLSQVWLSSLVGWVGGVDGPQVVGDDLERAARMLI
jgi:AcrR family transcriptional regulator